MVTVFTAFHWFAHEKAVEEIKRVMKPDGIFFAALKDNRSTSQNDKIRKVVVILSSGNQSFGIS